MNDINIARAVADKLQGIDLSSHERQVLMVSTSMIPKHTADALSSPASEINHSLSVEPWSTYGWIVCVPQEDACLSAHQELYNLMQFAAERGYLYLWLDCDGDPLPPECGLPEFQW